jgi:anti-sigma factor RsiW
MDCYAADETLDAVLDGEAPLEAWREVMAHLEECVACREEWAYRQLLWRVIRQDGEAMDTPPYLWERISAGIGEIDERRGPDRRRPLRPWGFSMGSALALIVMIGLLFSSWPWRSPASPFMVESVDNYIRYLLSNTPYDVHTRDADRVRQWFQGHLDFAADPPDLSADGFQLLGTRLGYFLDRVVAEMGYQRDGRRLSLFMTRGKGIEMLTGKRVAHSGQEFFVATSKGYTVIAWRDEPGNIVCSIVADLSQEQLLHVARKAARAPS